MGIQVRFRHSMGDRLLEIPARSADRPFVLGRGSESDLVLPAISVALRQCVLFVYEGQWAVQEWTPGGTQLNGRPIEGPTLLSIGDVLTIGSEASAATLEIHPGGAAMGRTGGPALEVTQSPPVRSEPRQAGKAETAWVANRSAPQMPSVPEVSLDEPAVAPPQPRTIGETASMAAEEVADGGEEAGEWDLAAAVDERTPRRRPLRRKPPSSAPRVVGVLLALAILGVTAWFVVQKMQAPPPPQVVVTAEPPAPPPPQEPSRPLHASIFTDNGGTPVHSTPKSPNAEGNQSSSGTAKADPTPAPQSPRPMPRMTAPTSPIPTPTIPNGPASWLPTTCRIKPSR